MTQLDWATALNILYADHADVRARSWAEQEVAEGRGTPGQRRALELLDGKTPVLDLLEAAPDRVRHMLTDVEATVLTRPPGPEEWTAVQIVHHLADNEAVNAVRLRSILTEDTPEIFGYDSDPWTRFFDIEPIELALERFASGRRNTVALARSLNESDLDRKGVLSYRGAETTRVLLTVLAGHDRDHLDQLAQTLEVVSGVSR